MALLVLLSALPASAHGLKYSAITLIPGKAWALEREYPGLLPTFTVYAVVNNRVVIATSTKGVLLKNVDVDAAMAYDNDTEAGR